MAVKLTAILLAGWLMASCTPLIQAASTGGSQKFLLFYSNDVRGETEPCG